MKVPREATQKRKRNIKYCTFLKCPSQAQGASRHKGAIGLCKRHGGGNPCQYIDGNGDKCGKSAQGSTCFCKAHGGGPRCKGFEKDGTKCCKGARDATG